MTVRLSHSGRAEEADLKISFQYKAADVSLHQNIRIKTLLVNQIMTVV